MSSIADENLQAAAEWKDCGPDEERAPNRTTGPAQRPSHIETHESASLNLPFLLVSCTHGWLSRGKFLLYMCRKTIVDYSTLS